MAMFQSDLSPALAALRSGGLLLYPTDTVWGIGCDATNADAVARVYAVKQRESKQSLLTLAADISMLQQYVRNIPDAAMQLLECGSDRPMTIVYPTAQRLPTNLIADDGSIGIRIPDDEFCTTLIKAFGKPIVSTSANIHGQPTPACFDEISDDVKAAMDYVVKWRQNDRRKTKASFIIKINNDNSFNILRK